MITLITTAQNLTGSWADLGSPVRTGTNQNIGLWINLDINDSLNARVRAIAQIDEAGGATSEHVLPIRTVGSSAVTVEDEYYEFNDDADQLVVLGVGLDGVIPFVQFQVQAGTAGATPGQIDYAYVTRDNF